MFTPENMDLIFRVIHGLDGRANEQFALEHQILNGAYEGNGNVTYVDAHIAHGKGLAYREVAQELRALL